MSYLLWIACQVTDTVLLIWGLHKITRIFPLHRFVLNTQTSQVIISQAHRNMNSICTGLFADAVAMLLLLTTEGLELAVIVIYCYRWTLWYQCADEIHSVQQKCSFVILLQ